MMCDNIVVIATLILSFISTIFVACIFYYIYREYKDNAPKPKEKVDPKLW